MDLSHLDVAKTHICCPALLSLAEGQSYSLHMWVIPGLALAK